MKTINSTFETRRFKIYISWGVNPPADIIYLRQGAHCPVDNVVLRRNGV